MQLVHVIMKQRISNTDLIKFCAMPENNNNNNDNNNENNIIDNNNNNNHFPTLFSSRELSNYVQILGVEDSNTVNDKTILSTQTSLHLK